MEPLGSDRQLGRSVVGLRARRLAQGLRRYRPGNWRPARCVSAASSAATTSGAKGIGPAAKRPVDAELRLGRKETNRVGHARVRRFLPARRRGAVLLREFLSDGEKRYAPRPEGNRTGDAQRGGGLGLLRQRSRPSGTQGRTARRSRSTSSSGSSETRHRTATRRSRKDEAIAHTIEFAKAMKAARPFDPLIGWGDRGARRPLGAGTAASAPASTSTIVAIT